MFGNGTESLVSRYRQFAKDCEHITLVFDGGNTSENNMLKVDQSGYHFITSLTLTHHKDLLQVSLRKFRSFAEPRLKGIHAYRTTKEIWGQPRTVVITRSEKLLAGQIAGIQAALRKKRDALRELCQKLLQSQRPKARGKGYSKESLKKRRDGLSSGPD